eukprot:945571-Amphidinium_carterae.1
MPMPGGGIRHQSSATSTMGGFEMGSDMSPTHGPYVPQDYRAKHKYYFNHNNYSQFFVWGYSSITVTGAVCY